MATPHSSAAADFDPYAAWLAIPRDRRPPTHYDLLGLALFEPDVERIRGASLERMAAVRRYQLGAHSETALQLIAEISQAFDCLTNAERKQDYDASLRKPIVPPPLPAPVLAESPPTASPQIPALYPGVEAFEVPLLRLLPARSKPRGLPVWPLASAAVAAALLVALVILFRNLSPAIQPGSPRQPPAALANNSGSPRPEPPPVKLLPAAAPFDERQAQAYQESWAKQLAVPAEISNSLGMKLRLIPPGEFPMDPAYTAVLTRPFWMGATEVTVAQFEAFVKDTGYKTDAERSGEGGVSKKFENEPWERRPENIWTNAAYAQGPQYPAAMVSWNDAAEFCLWLSQREGKKYRLPTEAEWEWACRAGSLTDFFFGDDPQALADYTWMEANSQGSSQPVAGRLPNAWGLFDLYGNAAEFCSDWFAPYSEGRQQDPQGPSEGARRCVRSAGFFNQEYAFGSGKRYAVPANLSMCHFGLRVVQEIAGD